MSDVFSNSVEVIHAVPCGVLALDCTNLETGERALVLTSPLPKPLKPQPVDDAWPDWFKALLAREAWRAPFDRATGSPIESEPE